jgi:hypothetical protein
LKPQKVARSLQPLFRRWTFSKYHKWAKGMNGFFAFTFYKTKDFAQLSTMQCIEGSMLFFWGGGMIDDTTLKAQ